jgi:hypothetical protein
MGTSNSLMIDRSQSGAALVTVIFVSTLLLTASVALLTALGAGAKETTDVLSETKAYYAAESGLQATINRLRNDNSISYSTVAASNSLVTSALYNWPTGSPTRAVLGQSAASYSTVTGSAYDISIADPDNTVAGTTYQTSTTFEQADGTYAATRVLTSGTSSWTLSYNNKAATTVAPNTGTSFGSFQITGTGALPSAVKFRIDYITTTGLGGTRTIRGTIGTDGTVTFISSTLTLGGATISMCGSVSACTTPTTTMSVAIPTSTPATVYAKMTATEPYRLLVTATGYGPNGAQKKLEGIIRRNFFDDFSSSAAISMVGPNAYFNPGTSHQLSILGGSNPSITFSDATGLANLNTQIQANNFNGTLSPAPEIASNDVPNWQQSTSALDTLVRSLRSTAQSSGRYFDSTHPPNGSFGTFANGTGLTFCEGNCGMSGNDSGGGILVVTGTFTTSGSPKFNGLVLVTGTGGVVRSGGGNELFTGNIVVAPYDPSNLAAGFLQPRYDQSGGPGDTTNSDVTVDQAFDGTTAISDFMIGVAEK